MTDLIKSWINQNLNSDATPTFNSVFVNDNVTIGGDLTVNGMTTIISTDVLEIKDNVIEINSAETGVGVTGGLSGLEVNRGSLDSYQIVFRELDDAWCIGESSSLQALATREDSPLSDGIAVFNGVTRRFDSRQTISLPITFNNGQNSSSSSDGSVRISGGIGITGDQYIDGRIYIKGINYNNYLDVNSSQETIVASSANILLNTGSAGYVKVPANAFVSYGGTAHTISGDGTDITIASSGRVIINPGNGNRVSLKTNSALDFGVSTENIVYDGTNLVLSATNNFDVVPTTRFTKTTASTGPTAGAVLLQGGLSISLATDATSTSNGGSFTTAGGVAVGQKLFVAGVSQFTNIDESLSISSLGGASVAKKLIVGSNYSGNPASGGIYVQSNGYTYTDNTTATSGTVSNVKFNNFGINVLSATNAAVVATNASTVYIEGAPVAGTNQTITNRYALNVNSGNVRLNGITSVGDTTESSGLTNGALTVAGGVSVAKNLNVARDFNVSSTVNTAPAQGVFLVFDASTVNDNTTTGVAGEMSFNYISAPTLTADNVITTTNASTLTIAGTPIEGSNQTITNAYTLWLKDGTLKSSSTDTASVSIDGGISISNTTDSTNSSTGGTIKTAGGVGIAKKLFVGGVMTVEDTTQSTTSSDGAARVSGGLSVIKNTVVGQGIVAQSDDFEGPPALGVGLKLNGNTFTDTTTSVSGTAAEFSSVSFEKTTLDATNATVTTTTASTLSIEGAPLDGTNQTITNAYALHVKQDTSLFAGKIICSDTTASTDPTSGAVQVSGGVGVSGSVNILANLDVNGTATLDQTTINTSDGQLQVSGSNGVNISVASASNYNTTSGNLGISSGAELTMYATSNATLDTPGIVSIDAGGNSNFTSSSGTMTISGSSTAITGTSGATTVSGGSLGGVVISTSDTTNGIKIGASNSNVPITIGHNSSEVIIGDNLTVSGNLLINGDTTTVNSTLITVEDNAIVVNSMPAGLSDGGFLVKRYQIPNDTSQGQVINDVPYQTSTFQAGSATPGTLVLNTTASAITDFYKGYWIHIMDGPAAGYVRRIKSYVGTTRTATLYVSADNSPTFNDGLDLSAAPALGNTYRLFPGVYSGIFFDDTNYEWAIGNVPFDAGAGTFPLNGYHNLHLNSLVLEGTITYGSGATIFNDSLIIDADIPDALLVRKNGNNGDVLIVATDTPSMRLSNPDGSVSSSVPIIFGGYDVTDIDVDYSKITSTIENNSSGAHHGSLTFSVSRTGTMTDYLQINANTQDTSLSAVSTLTVLNSVASSGVGTGAVRISGGVSISEDTDASSSTNGGSITTAGGVAIAKKLFVGNTATIDSTATTQTSGVMSAFSNNGTNKLNLIDEGTSSKPAGVQSAQSTGLGLYGNLLAVYDQTGSTLRASFTSTGASIFSSTVSSSTSTGALVVTGGVGIGGALNVNGNVNIGGNVSSGTWQGSTVAVSYGGTGATSLDLNNILIGNGTSAVQTSASLTYSSSTLTSPKLSLTDSADATSYTSAPLTVAGGLGVALKAFFNSALYTGGNVGVGTSTNVNNNITMNGDATIGLNTADASDSGSISIFGGGAIADTRGARISVYGNEHASGGSVEIAAGNNNSSGTVSLSTAGTSRLQVLYSGVTNFPLTTDSSSSSTGAITVAGGVGISKNLYVGVDLNVSGNSSVGTVTSGTWNGTTIAVANGGTGATTLTANGVLIGNGTSAVSAGANISYSTSTLTVPIINSTDTSQSTSTSTGAITLAGGIGIAKNAFFGEDLNVAGKIAIGTTTNINSALTLNAGSNIGINTVVDDDDGSLFISGSGTANLTRGALISLYGKEHANTGQLTLDAGNVAGASVKIRTQNTDVLVVSHSGITTIANNTNSTSSSTGALVLSNGGLAITNNTNASSSTNGGSFTTAGGVAVAQDVYVGGNLYVSGSVPGAVVISTPADATYNLVNVSSSSASQRKLLSTGAERTYSCVFTATPSAANAVCSFDIDVPGVITNFATAIDIVASVSGFHDLTGYLSVENLVCYSITGSTRAQIRFTSATTSAHYIQLILRYTIV
jgi:hypothetical protein